MRRGPGRPRSEQARQAVLTAGARLVEEQGYGALTMEALATGAGVSKQTIYRWWQGKAAVVLEALNEGARALAPEPDTGSLESDLRPFVHQSVAGAKRNAHVLAGLMAETQLDGDFGESFRSGFLAERRTVLRHILERARGRDEIAGAVDLDFLVDLVFAGIWYRILSRHGPLNRRFADRLTDAVLTLARPPGP